MPMSFAEKSQVVAVSVALSVGLATGLHAVFESHAPAGSNQPPPVKVFGSSDDAPIIMAGGSLYFGTGPDATFVPQGNDLAFPDGLKVSQIDIIDKDDKLQSFPESNVAGKSGTLTIQYCRIKNANCQAGKEDTITLKFDNTGNGAIAVSNTLSGAPIAKAPKVLPNLWTHMRKDWKMHTVTLVVGSTISKSADCGTDHDNECNIVVHTCEAGTGCAISK